MGKETWIPLGITMATSAVVLTIVFVSIINGMH